MSDPEQSALNARLAQDIADECSEAAMRAGASSVVVFVGVMDGKIHSAWADKFLGRTLEARGLLEFGYRDMVLTKMVFPVPPAKPDEVAEPESKSAVSSIRNIFRFKREG